MKAHKLIRLIVRLLFHAIARIELVGWEHALTLKGFVIASNHIGRLDAFLVYYALDRPDIIMLVAEKYKKHAFTRFLAGIADGIFIDRFNPDVRALREAMKRMRDGGVLAIAPEGTRSKSGALIQAHPGGIYLAWKAGVPILPVGVTGTQDAVVKDRLKHHRKLDIKATVGVAFTLPQDAKGKSRNALLQEYTDEVMCRIAALLPEEMHGIYAGHPRLKQLLTSDQLLSP